MIQVYKHSKNSICSRKNVPKVIDYGYFVVNESEKVEEDGI